MRNENHPSGAKWRDSPLLRASRQASGKYFLDPVVLPFYDLL
jgi:hypothetical protein